MLSKVPTATGRVEGDAKMDELVFYAIASGAHAPCCRNGYTFRWDGGWLIQGGTRRRALHE